MTLNTRKDLALFLSLIGVAMLAGAQFFWASSWELIAALSGTGVALILVAAAISPPFWWGNRSFTTTVNDPSHEAKQRHET